MVPLQAVVEGLAFDLNVAVPHKVWNTKHTEFLLDDLEDLLLVEFLGQTLNSRQSLTTIALCCFNRVSTLISNHGVRRGAVRARTHTGR